MLSKNKQGFTLIELLVVIAIIGLLANMVVVSLNNARKKSRDAKRASDVKQIQTALELYFADNDGYPTDTGVALGDNADANCLSSNGWGLNNCTGTTYMGYIAGDPGVESGYQYTYIGVADGSTYTITFGLAVGTESLSCSTYNSTCCSATPEGISCN